tara:strand:+ start:60795 stop:61040 length:246 start_codon:yes stop_codon:yes gene_type:complete
MSQDNTYSIKSLTSDICLRVPNGIQRVFDDILINHIDRQFTEFGNDMDIQWRKPPSGFPISLQFRLSCIESLDGQDAETRA